jgi:hypothetical protein
MSRLWDVTVLNAALGQAFFSLSLGMGAMITYGSYLTRREASSAPPCGSCCSTRPSRCWRASSSSPPASRSRLRPVGRRPGPDLHRAAAPVRHPAGRAPLRRRLLRAADDGGADLDDLAARGPGLAPDRRARAGRGRRRSSPSPRPRRRWPSPRRWPTARSGSSAACPAWHDFLSLMNMVWSDFALPIGGLLVALFVGTPGRRRRHRGTAGRGAWVPCRASGARSSATSARSRSS